MPRISVGSAPSTSGGSVPTPQWNLNFAWSQPSPSEANVGYYDKGDLSRTFVPISALISVAAGGTVGPLTFGSAPGVTQLTFAMFELRSLDNTEYICVEQDTALTENADVLFDGGVVKQVGTDLDFDPLTGIFTSTAGGLFAVTGEVNLAAA